MDPSNSKPILSTTPQTKLADLSNLETTTCNIPVSKNDPPVRDDSGEILKCKAKSGSPPQLGTSQTKPTVKMAGSMVFSHFTQIAMKFTLGTVVTLYILNQQHMLPKTLSAIVSKTLFWPTLPITFSRRIGKWVTVVDDDVVLGGAPFGWLGIPEQLRNDHNVMGVINMCEEYQGPLKTYKKLGMRELKLSTTDHFEPSLEDMISAVEFIREHKDNNLGKVYVHCRAGHGRSAAIVFGWLMAKADDIDSIDLEGLNEQLSKMRNVRKSLYKQPIVNEFRSWLSLSKKKQE